MVIKPESSSTHYSHHNSAQLAQPRQPVQPARSVLMFSRQQILSWVAIALLGFLSLLLMGWYNPAYADSSAQATFAGGCFWCMEHPFDELPGVLRTTSGYTGGTVANPTYRQVSSGRTGHVESVQVEYDPEQIGYDELLTVYWHNIDPEDGEGQFCDRGSQYRPVIFYHNTEQQQLAKASKQELEESGQFNRPIATAIIPTAVFYPAEDYHQNYYQTHPLRYRFYRRACGRDARLSEVWGSYR